MSEQIRAWVDNGSITDSELKQIQELSDKRKAAGADYCPYKKKDKGGKPFCGFTTRRCYKEEGYVECPTFQEFYLEEVASKFEDLMPIGG